LPYGILNFFEACLAIRNGYSRRTRSIAKGLILFANNAELSGALFR
jgi:hypothetical protein